MLTNCRALPPEESPPPQATRVRSAKTQLAEASDRLNMPLMLLGLETARLATCGSLITSR